MSFTCSKIVKLFHVTCFDQTVCWRPKIVHEVWGQENDSPVVQIGGGKAFFFVVVDLSGAEEADG
jgi:hypothetical protein